MGPLDPSNNAGATNAFGAGNGQGGTIQLALVALQNAVVSLNTINQTLTSLLPYGTAVVGSAGSSSGKYLSITAPDGNQYKIALLDP